MRKSDQNNQCGYCDAAYYAILAEDYFTGKNKPPTPPPSNIATLKTSTELMFHNLRIAMDTVDWSAEICGAPAWRYIYHTIHSADKWFINPSTRFNEPEPCFHTEGLAYPDNPSDTVLDRETLYTYYENIKPSNPITVLATSDVMEDVNGIRSKYGSLLNYYEHMGLIKRQFVDGMIKIGDVRITLIPVEKGKAVSVFLFESDGKKLIYAPCRFLTVASMSIVERLSRPTIAEINVPPFNIRLLRYADRERRSRKRSMT